MTSDPLTELLAHLERDGDVPLAWVVAHAPDGDLRRAWEACGDARTLLALCDGATDRRALVRAACACARTALCDLSAGEDRPLRAIETAEAWARGEATLEAVAAARIAVAEALADRYPQEDETTEAVHVAGLAAEAATERQVALYTVPDSVRDGDAALATIVRAHLPCPTLEQLRAAYRR